MPTTNSRLAAAPTARSVVAAGRAGWLPRLGRVRAGPIAALEFDHLRARGFREDGDEPVAQLVAPTRLDTLLARSGAGLEPAAALGRALGGFVAASAVRNLDRDDRVIRTAGRYAPDLPIRTAIGPVWNDPRFGRVDAAVTGDVARNLQLRLRGSATAFRRDAES